VVVLPEDSGLERSDRCFLVAAPLVDAADNQKSFGAGGLNVEQVANLLQRLIVAPFLIETTDLIQRLFHARGIRLVILTAAINLSDIDLVQDVARSQVKVRY